MASFNRRHVSLIARYSLKHSLRGGAGLVFLILALFFSLFAAQTVLQPIEQLSAQAKKQGATLPPDQLVANMMEIGKPVVEWVVLGSKPDEPEARDEHTRRQETWSHYLLEERPGLLSIIFLVLVFGMPFVVPFGAFNQTAGDIGSRGIRYLLLRAERGSIFLGRFVATALLTIFVHAFSVAVIALYVGLKLRIYGAGEVALWSLCGYFALVLLSLPYVALCAWLSSSTSSAFLSLVICTVVVGGVLLFAALAGVYWEPARYVKWLLPWGVQSRLLAPSIGQVAIAAGACLAYTGVYLAIGYRSFTRRDL